MDLIQTSNSKNSSIIDQHMQRCTTGIPCFSKSYNRFKGDQIKFHHLHLLRVKMGRKKLRSYLRLYDLHLTYKSNYFLFLKRKNECPSLLKCNIMEAQISPWQWTSTRSHIKLGMCSYHVYQLVCPNWHSLLSRFVRPTLNGYIHNTSILPYKTFYLSQFFNSI